jgi:sigma-B regulation protein RsbU (phosphoserine phosphatase)
MSAVTAWVPRSFPSPPDFKNPEAVLGAINRAFPMEEQNNRYFTLWYGVYQRSTRTMTYGAGGHPPALLVIPGEAIPKKLAAKGMMIGGMPGSKYKAQSCEIPPGARLFLFCDGAYELTTADGRDYTYDEFADVLAKLPMNMPIDLDALVAQIRVLNNAKPLDDDLSLITIQF